MTYRSDVAELIERLRAGDGNGCRHANETMSLAADALEAVLDKCDTLRSLAGQAADALEAVLKERDALEAATAVRAQGGTE